MNRIVLLNHGPYGPSVGTELLYYFLSELSSRKAREPQQFGANQHDCNGLGDDAIFLYDGTSVTTFFDAEAGIFFGNSISTATGYGVGSTLWSMYDIYDLDALDIGILPEPSTIFLMIGSASGLAVVAGVMRRKLR
ncbi:MAG: PEP-CTERM sorting domain-containing protein [Planctomycetota bacterium]